MLRGYYTATELGQAKMGKPISNRIQLIFWFKKEYFYFNTILRGNQSAFFSFSYYRFPFFFQPTMVK